MEKVNRGLYDRKIENKIDKKNKWWVQDTQHANNKSSRKKK